MWTSLCELTASLLHLLTETETKVLQEHYVLLLGAAIFLELAGAALFLANYSAGAYMLVRAHLPSLADTAHMLQA